MLQHALVIGESQREAAAIGIELGRPAAGGQGSMGSANWICWALAVAVAAMSQIHSNIRLNVARTLLPFASRRLQRVSARPDPPSGQISL